MRLTSVSPVSFKLLCTHNAGRRSSRTIHFAGIILYKSAVSSSKTLDLAENAALYEAVVNPLEHLRHPHSIEYLGSLSALLLYLARLHKFDDLSSLPKRRPGAADEHLELVLLLGLKELGGLREVTPALPQLGSELVGV